jgi:hypothetical protein
VSLGARQPLCARLAAGAVLLAGCLAGCKDEPAAPPLKALSPRPLPALPPVEGEPTVASDGQQDRDVAYRVAPAPVFGDALPKKAVRVELAGESVRVAGAAFDARAPDAAARLRGLVGEDGEVLLVPDADTFLMQAAPLLAALDDARVRTHLLHPDGAVSFQITLSDEQDFRVWLEQPRTGQVRVIHRADGFELQTNLGKLPGADPNGPSVPLRGGQWDLARLRSGLAVLKERFDADAESCIVPSFGMELASISRALTGYYSRPGSRLFPAVCLVYPRPKAGAADAGG